MGDTRPNGGDADLSDLKRLRIVAPDPSFVRSLHRLAFQAMVRLRWGRLVEPSHRESVAIEEFRARLIDLEKPMLGDEVTDEWGAVTDRIVDLAMTHDPRSFFGWDVIQRCLGSALNPSDRHFLRALRARPDYRSEWRPFLSSARAGRPAPFPLAPTTTAARITQLHHLAVLRDHTGRSIEDFDLVVEFGGGFGGMELLARERGFTGAYVIIDLPVMRSLQAFYLSLTRPVLITEDVRVLDTTATVTALIGLHQLAEVAPLLDGAENSLLMGTWSLSESPLPVRSQLYERLPSFSHVLIACQRSFSGIDNVTLPVELAQHADPTMMWHEPAIVRSRRDKVDPESRYAIGHRPPPSRTNPPLNR